MPRPSARKVSGAKPAGRRPVRKTVARLSRIASAMKRFPSHFRPLLAGRRQLTPQQMRKARRLSVINRKRERGTGLVLESERTGQFVERLEGVNPAVNHVRVIDATGRLKSYTTTGGMRYPRITTEFTAGKPTITRFFDSAGRSTDSIVHRSGKPKKRK